MYLVNICRILWNALIRHPGEVLAEYAKKSRPIAARKLFIETGLPIAEISKKTGFSDYNYFCRDIKKAGLPAGKYRALHKEDRSL